MYTYLHTYTHICIHTYIHTYLYVCVFEDPFLSDLFSYVEFFGMTTFFVCVGYDPICVVSDFNVIMDESKSTWRS
jgi:hypothetical protein